MTFLLNGPIPADIRPGDLSDFFCLACWMNEKKKNFRCVPGFTPALDSGSNKIEAKKSSFLPNFLLVDACLWLLVMMNSQTSDTSILPDKLSSLFFMENWVGDVNYIQVAL